MGSNSSVKYVLTYKKMGELISIDTFTSVFDALNYCQTEGIEEPVDIKRHEIIEERMLNRSQIFELLQRPE
ncbi:hypothetical protein [Salinispira pacifica]|uniref:Uncharacterized protein n=1 Tax=Salinispira pacifica TaxID=1307761 RepID=V5WHN1_9SPIO|nr:hypothetical protein [Salinispira pacifica]AHC15323.1 hypothetical protein L21SP2_1952 [Salinispira pacifica]